MTSTELCETAGGRTHGDEWVVAHASVPGSYSLSGAKPLQDAHEVRVLNGVRGVCVLADGAGSLEHSDIGASISATEIANELFRWLQRNGTTLSLGAPSEEDWRQEAYRAFRCARGRIYEEADSRNLDYTSMGSTALCVIFDARFLLVAHVGDGRAAYRSVDGRWRAATTPFKGPEAGSTLFLTSDIWTVPNGHPEYFHTRVVAESISAFALLSDGCERACFRCYDKLDDERYYDPNEPFPEFFEPNVSTLNSLADAGASTEVINASWARFLLEGSSSLPSLTQQVDDKTLILGCYRSRDETPCRGC